MPKSEIISDLSPKAKGPGKEFREAQSVQRNTSRSRLVPLTAGAVVSAPVIVSLSSAPGCGGA